MALIHASCAMLDIISTKKDMEKSINSNTDEPLSI